MWQWQIQKFCRHHIWKLPQSTFVRRERTLIILWVLVFFRLHSIWIHSLRYSVNMKVIINLDCLVKYEVKYKFMIFSSKMNRWVNIVCSQIIEGSMSEWLKYLKTYMNTNFSSTRTEIKYREWLCVPQKRSCLNLTGFTDLQYLLLHTIINFRPQRPSASTQQRE